MVSWDDRGNIGNGMRLRMKWYTALYTDYTTKMDIFVRETA